MQIDSGSDDEYYIGPCQTDRLGRFEICELPPRNVEQPDRTSGVHLTFERNGVLPKRLENIYGLTDDTVRNLRIELSTGRTVAGQLMDAAGEPIAVTLVEVLVGESRRRQAAMTDNTGRFRITGLPDGKATLRSHAIPKRQKIALDVVLDRDHNDLELQLKPYQLMAEPERKSVLGLTLCDVTPELKEIYDLEVAQGALVLDLGDVPEPLRARSLAIGDCICVAEFTRIKNVRDFVAHLIAGAISNGPSENGTYSVQFFFKSRRADFDGEDGDRIRLTSEDMDSLRRTLSELKATP